ncbi:hypothetical protein [Metabacillus halosaccharovorans]|uniref:Uncharacterized protein n=1 Tax=Metabacillus halosaccharovorans TaxID=930124 RepID=A0ABT3DGY0_9BACI|nr:hypothetical protein [Metabacillus halosaccharovorans]MCV9886310.1 hypothetical protein [Metabacillus halosaccharovorans]
MLWIYTQDQQKLIKVNEVTVKGKKIVGVVRNSTYEENIDLGKYESNIRASEVLHKIFLEIRECSSAVSVEFAMPEK